MGYSATVAVAGVAAKTIPAATDAAAVTAAPTFLVRVFTFDVPFNITMTTTPRFFE
ncbi:hypothetical protein GCM10010353_70980 [Streptomyces chryseus]|nr:hypothetical protein GCM10010353_70980 [Streptomyces chryseus]